MTETARVRAARSSRRQRGVATAEYTIVALFVVIVLFADDNVIKQLADAIRNAYTSFVYALSVAWL